MINIEGLHDSDKLLPLADAVQLATGHRPHLSTLLRWCQKPNQYGIRLKSWKVGGRRLTTVAAVRCYVDQTTIAADFDLVPASTTKQQSNAHQRAMASLEREGL